MRRALLALAGIVLLPVAVPIIFFVSALAALLAPLAFWAAYMVSGSELSDLSDCRALVLR
jgi:hypothetical protein